MRLRTLTILNSEPRASSRLDQHRPCWPHCRHGTVGCWWCTRGYREATYPGWCIPAIPGRLHTQGGVYPPGYREYTTHQGTGSTPPTMGGMPVLLPTMGGMPVLLPTLGGTRAVHTHIRRYPGCTYPTMGGMLVHTPTMGGMLVHTPTWEALTRVIPTWEALTRVIPTMGGMLGYVHPPWEACWAMYTP